MFPGLPATLAGDHWLPPPGRARGHGARALPRFREGAAGTRRRGARGGDTQRAAGAAVRSAGRLRLGSGRVLGGCGAAGLRGCGSAGGADGRARWRAVPTDRRRRGAGDAAGAAASAGRSRRPGGGRAGRPSDAAPGRAAGFLARPGGREPRREDVQRGVPGAGGAVREPPHLGRWRRGPKAPSPRPPSWDLPAPRAGAEGAGAVTSGARGGGRDAGAGGVHGGRPGRVRGKLAGPAGPGGGRGLVRAALSPGGSPPLRGWGRHSRPRPDAAAFVVPFAGTAQPWRASGAGRGGRGLPGRAEGRRTRSPASAIGEEKVSGVEVPREGVRGENKSGRCLGIRSGTRHLGGNVMPF